MFFESDRITLHILSVLQLEWNGRNDRSDYRPFHALSFRIRGNASMQAAGDSGVIFETGDIAFVPANLTYTQVAGAERLLVVHFTADDPLPHSVKKFTPKNPEYFERKFTDLYRAWSKKQAGYAHECNAILYKILLEIENQWNERERISGNDKLREAVEYIHDHFTDHTLTVSSLARQCGMSDTYFRKLFLAHLSVTPLKYINQLRMTYARELLQSNYYTIEEISEKCGFNNINYFSLFVKKQTGVPPSVYREQLTRTRP
ncbi:MAG: helix-turn-helix transcriptional regulator [Clostridia bacterium]|nr:helix-turn-helix transcriptional regulator [Clostridia bacterium]